MCSLESLKIDLAGLKEGETTFAFDLGNDYFDAVEATEVTRGAVHVDLSVNRSGSMFGLDFSLEGTVIVPCDICLDDMEQPVSAESSLTARLGEACADDDDLITVGREEGTLDVSWLIYEMIALNVPVKHVHEEGKCNPEMLKLLKEHSASRDVEDDGGTAVDSRWSELEKLKTIIKD